MDGIQNFHFFFEATCLKSHTELLPLEPVEYNFHNTAFLTSTRCETVLTNLI